MWHCVIWYKLADVSEQLTGSHGVTTQKTAILSTERRLQLSSGSVDEVQVLYQSQLSRKLLY
jgi:hypothetical protein